MSNPTRPIAPPGDPDNHERIEALQTLLRRTVDAEAGFETMVDRAEPEFEAVARKFRGEHQQHAERISAIIAAHGGEPDADGSLMSSVNQTVVSIRALFDEIDDDVMDQVRQGEGHVMDAFDEAAGKMPEGRDREELLAMKAELQTLLDETSHLD